MRLVKILIGILVYAIDIVPIYYILFHCQKSVWYVFIGLKNKLFFAEYFVARLPVGFQQKVGMHAKLVF